MATILFTWELGGGLGHLVNLMPLAQAMSRKGHRVYAAVQDVPKAARIFRGFDIAYLQAPTKFHDSPNAIMPPRTFAHILHNRGFGELDELRAMAGTWRNLLEMTRPDLVVFDHSPTALLAARGLVAKKALIGTGFFCPLDEYAMADLRPWLAEKGSDRRAAPSPPAPLPEGEGRTMPSLQQPVAEAESRKTPSPPAPLPEGEGRLKEDEDRVLANANAVLAGWGQPPLVRLSRLFYDVDEHFLATLPELDHYPGRCGSLWPREAGETSGRGTLTPCPSPGRRGENDALTPCPSPGGRGEIVRLTPCLCSDGTMETRYWGAWPNVGGRPADWPEGPGKKVFAYVKPFPALARLLQQLCDLRQPTIVHGDGIDADLRRRFTFQTMRFESEPVDLADVGRTCDLAVLNGNHGTTVSMLLAGKPTLQLPITLEQALFARAVERLGAAVMAPADRPQSAVAALMEMLAAEHYAEAARRFAARYAGYDPQRQVEAVVRRAEELLS